MTIVLKGSGLTIADVVAVARDRRAIELEPRAVERIRECRAAFERRLTGGAVIYGVNTGIGDFCERRLSDDEMARFQENLVRSHAAGIGAPLPEDVVRSAMLARINVHAQGRSACRPEITQTYVRMLNEGVTPVVCSKGSVGACGDLAPMAQIALLLLGEGEAFYKGERMPGRQAMERAGIPMPGLRVRDGLAAINGSNVIAGLSALTVDDMDRWLRQAEIVVATAMEALGASIEPLHPLLHQVRPFAGAMRSASSILRCLEGGDLYEGKVSTKVQDAYSLRSSAQIIGAAHDALAYARKQVEIEINSVCDNPIMFPENDLFLTGANFQGTPVSLPMDMMSAAITAVCVLSERRLNRLLNPALSNGLPAFLANQPGPDSGFMLSQYTAGMLIVEQRMLSAPASVGSIPAAADQEDFVSMGMNTALKNRQIMDNAYGVLGIEMMSAVQAVEYRQRRWGTGVRAACAAVREHVPRLCADRQLWVDHERMAQLIRSGFVLDAVDAAVGASSSN